MTPDSGAGAAALRLRAMNYLARREHSRFELERKLLDRCSGSHNAVIETLDHLESEGLLSDRRFAEAFTRSRIGRGQGPLRIRAELLERRVPETEIDRSLATAGVDWEALAQSALEKRFGDARAADYREKTRRMRFLQQRGFSGEQIRKAMDNA